MQLPARHPSRAPGNPARQARQPRTPAGQAPGPAQTRRGSPRQVMRSSVPKTSASRGAPRGSYGAGARGTHTGTAGLTSRRRPDSASRALGKWLRTCVLHPRQDPARPASALSGRSVLTYTEACRAHSRPFSPFQFTCPQSHQHEASGFALQIILPGDKANTGTNPSALLASRYSRQIGKAHV